MQIRTVFFRQGMPEDSPRKSGTTFYLLLLYLSKQMCLLSFFLTCRHLHAAGVAIGAGTSGGLNAAAWLTSLTSKCQAVTVLTATSLTHRLWHMFISLSFVFWGERVEREVVITQFWGEAFSRASQKAFQVPAHVILSLGIWASQYLVNMFDLSGVLHFLGLVTLFWNNILESEKIQLEKSHSLMLCGASGTLSSSDAPSFSMVSCTSAQDVWEKLERVKRLHTATEF